MTNWLKNIKEIGQKSENVLSDTSKKGRVFY
jgi:hypothetical protein